MLAQPSRPQSPSNHDRYRSGIGRASGIVSVLRRHLTIKVFVCAIALLLTLDIALEQESSYSRKLWKEISLRTIESRDAVIHDLLDPDMLVATPGKDLIDQLETAVGPYSMSLLSVPRSGRPFELAVQCASDIVGKSACPPMYFMHFRGPVAYSVPPRYDAFRHDAATGRTIVTVTLTHPGIYELWAYPEWPVPNDCPPERGGWGPDTPPVPAISGSGQTIITVLDEISPPPHHTRPCSYEDYRTPMESVWVSLAHIREEYRGQGWLSSHFNRSNSLHPHGEMPDYIYLPYQCKRPALDFRAMADENKAMKHVLYLGDSIMRTHFCGHLWPTFHDSAEVDPSDPASSQCVYSDDIHGYHFADRSFEYTRRTPTLGKGNQSTSDPSSTILFSQRFVANDVSLARQHLDRLAQQDPPVTHVVANIGMWFGVPSPESYSWSVHDFIRIIIETLGIDVQITWLHTAASVPGINCWHQMKRERLRHHSSYANVILDEIRDWYPTLRLRAIDSFPILDHRPETASDGRHYVREGPLPNILRRPMVGRGDDAVHDLMWAAWLEDYRQSQREI